MHDTRKLALASASLGKLSTGNARAPLTHAAKAPQLGAKPLVVEKSAHNKLYGESGEHNCGWHLNHDDDMGTEDELALACSDCFETTEIFSLHRFRCGHILCRHCLDRRATQIVEAVNAHHVELTFLLQRCWEPDMIRATDEETLMVLAEDEARMVVVKEEALGEEELQAELGEGELEAREELKAELQMQLQMELLKQVADKAHLGCCGLHLLNHAQCMDPNIAQRLALVLSWLDTIPTERSVCGWPDCGAHLNRPEAYFRDEKSGSHGCVKLYCTHCHGHSQVDQDKDCVTEDETVFPWRIAPYYLMHPAR